MNDEQIKELQRQAAKLNESISRITGERKTPLFGDFAESYHREKLGNPTLRESTKESFSNQVRNHLIPGFGAIPLDRLGNHEWLTWVTGTRTRTPNVRFFNARKALVEILTAAKSHSHIEKLPKLDNPDLPKNVGRALERKEIAGILLNSSRYFRFIFWTFFKMGCRPREILQWEWSMIKWGEPKKTWIEIPARISKTDRSRKIPLNPLVSRLLSRRYIRMMESGDISPFVFPKRGAPNKPQMTYQSAWTAACKKAGVTAVVYDLRRTFITQRAGAGKPLVYLAKQLDTSVGLIESVYAKGNPKAQEDIAA